MPNNPRFPAKFLLTVLAFSVLLARADYLPVTLTPESYTFDMVVEKEALRLPITASMDDGLNLSGNTWYEVGYNAAAPTTGLPAAGSTIISQAAADHQYTMPASYQAANAVMLENNVKNATITLSTPAAFSALSFLGSSGRGVVVVGYTLRFADGNTETGTFSSPDWFNATPTVLTSNGRVNATTGVFGNVNSGNPRLYSIDVTVANATTPIASIDLTFNSGGSNSRAALFALSASTGGEFLPVAITGFNADMVVEATASAPAALNATSATMDGGAANTGYTWYEQGYQPIAPTTGLPSAGTTLTSVSANDHGYTLAGSYTANNATLVDATHNALLTLATPASYSGLSLLAASGGGSMTVDYIITHSDSSTQTGSVIIPDWFNNSPYVLTTRGRAHVGHGGLNAVMTENPRLYAVDIAVANTTTPIASVAVNYKTGTGRSAILALSAATGPIKPIFDTQPVSLNVFSGSTVEFTATVSGTAPITYQWQKDVGGTFVNVTDGGNVSGAATATLKLENVVLSDGGSYQLVASNVAGSSTSAVVRLNVLSNLPDVTSPSDEIVSVGGNSPATEMVPNAINNTTTKYLNYGTDGNTAAPFVGPAGLIVTPAAGPTVVTGLRVYTANDATERDPVDYILEGSNDGGTIYAMISSGPLALPTNRNGANQNLNPLTHWNQEVNFPNGAAYLTYRLTFQNVRNNTSANSVQVGEIELLGVATPKLSIVANTDSTVTVSWSGTGKLQSTTALQGVQTQWTDEGTVSPITFQTTGPIRIFRVIGP
jgi:hypothetical protein